MAAALGPRCHTVAGDLVQEAVRVQLFAAAEQAGGLTILVNNAALTKTKSETLGLSLLQWDAIMDVNLRAVFDLCLRAARYWHSRALGGSIVNVSSPGAQRAHSNNVTYDVSKGGVDAIAPAQVPHSHSAAERHAAASGLPIRGGGQAGDAADAILFLASDAARFITGHVLPVDGGLLAQLRVTGSLR